MGSCLSKKFLVRFFLKYISLYLIWDTVCFKLFQSLPCVIVWLVEAIKNLHPCIVLNSIYLSYAFYCEVDPYYHCQYTTGNYFQYTHCLWQLITLYVVVFVDHLLLGFLFVFLFYFQEILVAPVVFLAFLKMFLIPIKFTMMEDKPFPLGTLCHCEKCIEFGLFVWTLFFLGVLYLIPS